MKKKKNEIIMEKDYSYKILILGDICSGKTAFLKKICEGTFSGKSLPTIGIDTKTLDMYLNDGKKVSLKLFDTNGEERARILTRTYIKGSDGIILMYDITDRRSFVQVRAWIDLIKEEIENYNQIPIILLGNKKDLPDGFYYKRERVVTEEKGKQLAEEINAFKFLEISVLEDSQDYLKESILIPLARCLSAPEKIKEKEKIKKFEEKKKKKRKREEEEKKEKEKEEIKKLIEEIEKKMKIEEKAEKNLKILTKYISF